jgi:MoxR-like ATPase
VKYWKNKKEKIKPKEEVMASKNALFKLLHGLYHTKVPTMIWSDPGMGKTSTVKFVGRQLGVETEMRSGNKSDPTDFSGIPYLLDRQENGNSGEKILNFSEPKYVRIMKNNPNGILFFDEITTCPPVIQSALLSIIQDCEFGEFSIPQTIFRVAAGNYNTVAGTHNMSLALMNRFCHIFYELDMEYFLDGFVSGWANYELAKINTPAQQIDKVIDYRIKFANFLKENPMYIEGFPKDGTANNKEVAYPTPRSWEMVVKILSVLDKNEPDYIEELVKGCVGEAAGTLFLKFIEKDKGLRLDIPRLAGREDKFVLPNPDRHDHVSQIMAAVVYYLEQNPKKYFNLWLRTLDLLHNENGQFGDYAAYDNFIMKYLLANIKLLLKTKTIEPKDMKDLSKRIPCYDLLGSIGG